MLKNIRVILASFCLIYNSASFAAEMVIPMFLTAEKGVGPQIGTITVTETKYGLLFTPNILGLKPGLHGFHIHENASCNNGGMDAGSHLDPSNTKLHLGPFNDKGHLGDLPVLIVFGDGSATLPVLAPRITSLIDLKDHALMIHDGADNYTDVPEKLGGGGARIACGIMK